MTIPEALFDPRFWIAFWSVLIALVAYLLIGWVKRGAQRPDLYVVDGGRSRSTENGDGGSAA